MGRVQKPKSRVLSPQPNIQTQPTSKRYLSHENKWWIRASVISGLLLAAAVTVAVLSGVGVLGLAIGATIALSVIALILAVTFLSAGITTIKKVTPDMRRNKAIAQYNTTNNEKQSLFSSSVRLVEIPSKTSHRVVAPDDKTSDDDIDTSEHDAHLTGAMPRPQPM